MVCTAHGALHFPFAERESHRMDEAGCARAPPSLDMVIVVADTELLPFMTEQLSRQLLLSMVANFEHLTLLASTLTTGLSR